LLTGTARAAAPSFSAGNSKARERQAEGAVSNMILAGGYRDEMRANNS
jgi:hypothetical protein